MTQFTGTFINDVKVGETCQLIALDDENEIVEYTGGFKDDQYSGMGILLLKSGQIFKGDFEVGQPKEGILKYANGEEYTGPLTADFKREGYGIMNYKSGEQYCGDFVSDLKCGKGICKLSNGENINGVWQDDKLVMGQQRIQNGVYFGSYDDQMLPSGKGILQYDNGVDVYQGTWKHGQREGWGHYKDAVSTFKGIWRKGLKYEGTLTYTAAG